MSETFHNDAAVTVEITNRLPDSARQCEERNQIGASRRTNAYITHVGNELIKHIKSSVQKIDRVDILGTKSGLVENEKENGRLDGTIEFDVRVLHAGYTKETPITVKCCGGNVDMPSAEALSAEFESKKSNEDKAAESMQTEAAKEAQIMAELSDGLELSKEASAGPCAGNILTTVIHVDKNWLPEALTAGDTISVDGVRYLITGDDHNKLSASSDGAFWTLRLVDETAAVDSKKTKHMFL